MLHAWEQLKYKTRTIFPSTWMYFVCSIYYSLLGLTQVFAAPVCLAMATNRTHNFMGIGGSWRKARARTGNLKKWPFVEHARLFRCVGWSIGVGAQRVLLFLHAALWALLPYETFPLCGNYQLVLNWSEGEGSEGGNWNRDFLQPTFTRPITDIRIT